MAALNCSSTSTSVPETPPYHPAPLVFNFLPRLVMSSPTVHIESAEQFRSLLSSSKIVVADCECHPKWAPPLAPRPVRGWLPMDSSLTNCPLATVYADWCGPCKMIAPIYEQLSAQLSNPGVVTFTKVNTDKQKDIAGAYSVSSLPTFITFRDGKPIDKVQGANPASLKTMVEKLTQEVQNVGGGGGSSSSIGGGASSSAGGSSALGWRGAELPRGYTDVTDQIEMVRTELLNFDDEFGTVRVLFDSSKPGALSGGKKTEKDWVVSDTDEQLLLFTPFMSMVKLHTLQVRTACPQVPPLKPRGARGSLADVPLIIDYFHRRRRRRHSAPQSCQAFYQPTAQPWL